LSEVAQAQSKNGISEPLQMITNVSNELVGTMSDIVWSINPAKDHFADLIQRMRRFASDLLSPKKIGLQFDSPESDGEIIVNSNVRREVFLIFKESINNIVKYSEAKKVSVEIKVADDKLFLQIRDDGKGFDLNGTSSENYDFGGNGIPGMKRRAGEMNGEFEIVSEEGKGTTVNLILPMDLATQAGGKTKAQS
jgi:signal transduction histidine kinase